MVHPTQNPAIRPQPTMPGTYANSQMPVGWRSPYRWVNRQSQALAQREAEMAFQRSQGAPMSNPRSPTMPGTYADSMMPVGPGSMHRGQNIEDQRLAQQRARQHEIQTQQHAYEASLHGWQGASRMPNPWYMAPTMPGSYGLSMPGQNDYRGKIPPSWEQQMAAIRQRRHPTAPRLGGILSGIKNKSAEAFRRALELARQAKAAGRIDEAKAWLRYALKIRPGDGGIVRTLRNLQGELQSNPIGAGVGMGRGIGPQYMAATGEIPPWCPARATNPKTSTDLKNGFGPLSRFSRSLQRASAPRISNPTNGSKDLLALCRVCNPEKTDCWWVHCRDLEATGGTVVARAMIPRTRRARVANPPPRRSSRGDSDVMLGVYTPAGETFVDETMVGGRSLASLIARELGLSKIQIREYRGDGRGGWAASGVDTITTTAGRRPTPARAKAKKVKGKKSSNPCTACAGRAAYMPKIG